MMTTRFWILVCCVLLSSTASFAEIDPEQPLEFLPYPNSKLIDPQVSVKVTYQSGADLYRYEYVYTLKPSSQQNMFDFSLKSEAEIEDKMIGTNRDLATLDATDWAPANITMYSSVHELEVRPGESVPFAFSSKGIPSVADTYSAGYVEPPSGQQVVLPPTSADLPAGEQEATWENTQVHLLCVGPLKRPEPFGALEEADFLLQELPKAVQAGWISSSPGLDTSLASLRSSIATGNPSQANQQALALLQTLESLRGPSLSDEGYYVIRPHIDRIAYLQQPVASRQTLQSSKDAPIYDRGPHVNEGANPRLPLKKVTGKPAHFALGFDLAGVNTAGLTKATLVLSIDPAQNVTGWGNGRTVRVRRLTTVWVEGNGKSLDLPSNQKTTGSGQGVTWFSPIDSEISNSQANSTVSWSGGASFTNGVTAPLVTIHNHDSGEVSFDVTQDVLAGSPNGWLVTRDDDVGSQVTFYSREGGLATGNAGLAPRLILDYGDTALNDEKSPALASLLDIWAWPVLAGPMLSSGSTPVLLIGLTALRALG